MERVAALAAVTLAIVAAIVVVATTGGLPDTVATHFARDGRADGWM